MNSKSDIIDELNLIKSNIPKENKKNNTVKTIDDIIESKIKSIEEVLDSKVVNMYERPWNKLEIKLKQKKIQQYFENNKTNIDKQFVIKNLNNKKKVKVIYNHETCLIENIDILV